MTLPIRQALRDTIARFNGAHIDSPAATARAVLTHALNRPREWMVAHDDAPLGVDARERLAQLVDRVIAHEPLAYVLGHREFFGVELLVDRRALIPRPETEMLVELALDHMRLNPELARECDANVIDVGTGSGAVAIAVSVNAPAASVVATDVSYDALDLARSNAERHGVSGRVQFVHGDLLEAVAADVQAQVIVANLPYVTVEEIEALPPEIQSHEPRVALDGGPDGLLLVRRLLMQLDIHLVRGGMAAFEIGAAQGPAALQLAYASLPGWRVVLRQDLAKLDRVLLVTKP